MFNHRVILPADGYQHHLGAAGVRSDTGEPMRPAGTPDRDRAQRLGAS